MEANGAASMGMMIVWMVVIFGTVSYTHLDASALDKGNGSLFPDFMFPV